VPWIDNQKYFPVTLIQELGLEFRSKNSKKRLVAWMVTNCNTPSEREKIVQRLKSKVQVSNAIFFNTFVKRNYFIKHIFSELYFFVDKIIKK
jgi:hypothetical protein